MPFGDSDDNDDDAAQRAADSRLTTENILMFENVGNDSDAPYAKRFRAAVEANDSMPAVCLMCRIRKNPADFRDAASPYCDDCSARSRADFAAWMKENWHMGDESISAADDETFIPIAQLDDRWQRFIVACSVVYDYKVPWRRLTPESVRNAWQSSAASPASGEPPLADGYEHPQSVARLRIFHWDIPGYIEGLWDIQHDYAHWSLREIRPERQKELREIWLPALRNAAKRGPGFGSRTVFAGYADFMERCRRLVTPEGWYESMPKLQNTPHIKEAIWERIVAGKVAQDDLVPTLDCGKASLTRALKVFRASDGLIWRDFQRQLARWASEQDSAN